jgi:putative ABC transport system substrate-binding protein
MVQPNLPRRRAAELAVRHRISAVSAIHGFVEEGGLMSYASSEAEISRRAATVVGRILKGAKPSHLPLEQPTNLELLIHMKTVKALGLTIPPSRLACTNVVIE